MRASKGLPCSTGKYTQYFVTTYKARESEKDKKKKKYIYVYIYQDSLVAQTVKSLPAMWETRVQSLGQEDPCRRKWQPAPVFLPGKSHGGRSLAGYIRSGKQLDPTERLHFHFLSYVYICVCVCVPI